MFRVTSTSQDVNEEGWQHTYSNRRENPTDKTAKDKSATAAEA